MKTWRWFVPAGVLLPLYASVGCGEFDPDTSFQKSPTVVPGSDAASDDADPGEDAGPGVTVPEASPPPFVNVGPVGPAMNGLHVVGNQILNAQAQVVALHGVNRSGTEYKCVQRGGSVFDGPSDEASIQTIVSWKANAVRIPLNETCWLGINGVAAATSGPNYQNAILAYVALLHQYNVVPIIELHWVGPNNTIATAQQPMPDAASVTFWQSVTAAFASDDGVIFEPYNEPFPGMNRDTAAAWTCWRDGCTGVTQAGTARDAGTMTYTAVGMQALVDAIRGAEGSIKHVVLLGGVEYSNDLSMWLTYAATDPAGNLGAAWHVYNYNACITATCWTGAPSQVALSVPIVATEIGERDCLGSFIDTLMPWLDTAGIGYLAWSWDAYGACVPQPPPDGGPTGSPYSLITDYVQGTPDSDYAKSFHDHIAAL